MPFVKDALYSYMVIPEFLEPLIDSAPVQRLRRIRQLAGTEYVYPGATHTRFEHSLGVMHLAGRLCDILNENPLVPGTPVVAPDEKRAVMAAALLHDIGHGPFSHLFEKLYEDKDKNHEDITRWLIETELADTLARMDLDPVVVGNLATGARADPGKAYLSQVVAGTIDCDSLDYLVRDSFYTGALVGNLDVQRIMLMTRVLDGNLAFDLKIGVPIMEGYFLFRLNSFKQIYFHKTSRSAQIMIQVALEHKRNEFDLGMLTTPSEFLKWDDYTLWTTIQDDPFMARLKRRDMLKMVYERGTMSDHATASRLSAAELAGLASSIEAEAGVPPRSVFIDVPYFPTVPYAHATTFDPEDIPVFELHANEVVVQKLSELSVLFSLLKGYHNIVRVYAFKEHRDAVARAASTVLSTNGL